MLRLRLNYTVLILAIVLVSCKKDPQAIIEKGDAQGPVSYDLQLPAGFPAMPVPVYNKLTVEGVALGKKLFYDPLLSGNNTQSCAGCHQPEASFVDKNIRFSRGSTGALVPRNSMPIFNIGYARKWFWDGRSKTLEEQVFHPVVSQNEMNQDPIQLAAELSSNEEYVKMFRAAFGDGEINFDRTAKAIAQFMRSIIAYSPKVSDTSLLSMQEKRGLRVFLDENKGDCFHCHELGNFMTTFEFSNNGLNLNALADAGLYNVTGKGTDIGKFKIPSLLNLKYTAPYMHDGRFKTLEEVIEFYDTGFHWHPITNANLDANMLKHFDKTTQRPQPRKWTLQDKKDLIAYLNALTDETLNTNPKYVK